MSTATQLVLISPLLAVTGWALLLLMVGAFAESRSSRYVGHLALVGLGLAFALTLYVMSLPAAKTGIWGGRVVVDGFAGHLWLLVISATALTVLLSPGYLEAPGIDFDEYYPLILFSLCGMMIIAAAGDLMVLIIGIETMTLPVYALCGSWRKRLTSLRQELSVEAAFKYFVVGAFATAVAAYGLAMVYGATGTTILKAMAASGTNWAGNTYFIFGMVLLVASLGFKVAAVPFHMWTPDVYEGAPTPITGFMAAAVKAAAFAAVVRAIVGGFGAKALAYGPTGWTSLLAVVAAATMILGNLAALRQENVKRMLAYSSVAHAGYLLLGVIAAGATNQPAEARSALLFYLWAYTFTTIGAFGVTAWIGRREGKERTTIDDWAGLGTRSPVAALAMTIFLISLAGIPPTAGFFAKLLVFKAAMGNTGLLWLVIIGVLTSVISVFYYLKVVVAMYFREPASDDHKVELIGGGATALAMAIAAAGVLVLGLFPSLLWKSVVKAVTLF